MTCRPAYTDDASVAWFWPDITGGQIAGTEGAVVNGVKLTWHRAQESGFCAL